jgi:signal transduction histidine kinase
MKRWPWLVAGASVITTLVSIPFSLMAHLDLMGDFVVQIVLGSIALVLVGALLATRVPDNAVGWIYLAAGTIYSVQALAQAYAGWAFGEMHRTDMPLEQISAWWAYWAWLTAFSLFAGLGFLLFPDGKPPSRRWRPVVWGGWAIVAMTTFNGIAAWGAPPKELVGMGPGEGPDSVIGMVGANLFPLLVVLGAASLVVRFVHSDREVRKQIEWVVIAAAALVATSFAEQAMGTNGGTILTAIAFPAVPIAVGVAILKYRLWDIDIVVRKTLMVGVMAAFISLVYVAVVAGVGALVGTSNNAVLSAIAAACVALAFLPVRSRARRIADRVVYGKRATPYEALTEFSGRASDTLSIDEVLPQMARVLGEGTGAAFAEVWLVVGGALERRGVWPEGDAVAARTPLRLNGRKELPDLAPAERSTPVLHQGELLGALTLAKPANDPLNPADASLMDDLAEQAGLVLRNARLVEDLRSSRQRLVAAQDEERRKIERNLHDGAQQQLIALGIKVNLAKGLASKDADKATKILEGVQSDLQDSIDTLRDLARGIYPPLLADQGLAAALEAQARKAGIATKVRGAEIGRYTQDIEAGAYFCCLEALQNIAKYAHATQATISLDAVEQTLTFIVADDGDGFDTTSTNYGTGLQGMADRLDAIGGSLKVESTSGAGTTVTGTIPIGSDR